MSPVKSTTSPRAFYLQFHVPLDRRAQWYRDLTAAMGGVRDVKWHIRYVRILLDYWFKRSFGTEGRQQLLKLFLELTNCRILTPESTVLEKVCYALH